MKAFAILALFCAGCGHAAFTSDLATRDPPGPGVGPARASPREPRRGTYVDPKVTREAAATLHLDTQFSAAFDGISFGEMLYVDDLRTVVDALFVATSTQSRDGARRRERPVDLGSLGCSVPSSIRQGKIRVMQPPYGAGLRHQCRRRSIDAATRADLPSSRSRFRPEETRRRTRSSMR